ncbi:hypothetical protein B0H13DRAFT_2016173 [Mycena leptocephala]|nr:hypothetical protein B0H13DRAFT_2016173 [Mycena leptocephala]
MQSTSSWLRFPAEIELEVAAHLAEDKTSLRAMSLVSKRMRLLAIEHLFSVVNFVCAQDFSQWLNMLHRTPRLRTVVRRVAFLDTNIFWAASAATTGCCGPPEIPIMPNVRVVHWGMTSIEISMAVAYMALFPNIKELSLYKVQVPGFDELAKLLGACGVLRVLSFNDTHIEGDSRRGGFGLLGTVEKHKWPLDLSALEELAVKDCFDEHEYLIDLLVKSHPTGLRSLTFSKGVFDCLPPCSIPAMVKLLRLAAPSLVNLTMDYRFLELKNLDIVQLEEMFASLPAFSGLDVITIRLGPNRVAGRMLDALKSAPNLTALHFRFIPDCINDEQDYQDFRRILNTVFSLEQPHFMKSVMTQKFPLIQRIGFHFCVDRSSSIHFRRGLRKRMEQQLREHLEKSGVDVAKYLDVKWLDERYNPVVYNETNGNPHWKHRDTTPEPETETDCGSDEG